MEAHEFVLFIVLLGGVVFGLLALWSLFAPDFRRWRFNRHLRRGKDRLNRKRTLMHDERRRWFHGFRFRCRRSRRGRRHARSCLKRDAQLRFQPK